MNFFNGPKFGESCWNYHVIAVHLRTVYFATRDKKEWQNSLPFLPLFCRWFCYYFALVGKIDTTSLARECRCILCPNIENFCQNNGQFLSIGDATASPCRTLMCTIYAFATFSTYRKELLFRGLFHGVSFFIQSCCLLLFCF